MLLFFSSVFKCKNNVAIFLTSSVFKCKNNVAIFLTSSVRTTLLSFSLQVYSSIITMLRFSHFKLKTSENVANRSVFVLIREQCYIKVIYCYSYYCYKR